MKPTRRPCLILFAGLLACWASLVPSRAALGAPGTEQSRLEASAAYARAWARLERRSVEMRRMAITDLERATLLQPENAEYQLTLARTYYVAGFVKQAMRRFEKVVAIAPDDPEARHESVWRGSSRAAFCR